MNDELTENGTFISIEYHKSRISELEKQLAKYDEIAAEYGIDGETMLILAKSQIKIAKENIVLRETLEESQRGEWLVTDAYPHRVYCSVCYKTNVPNEEWLFEKNEYPHFCMWCGAKMLRFGHANGTT